MQVILTTIDWNLIYKNVDYEHKNVYYEHKKVDYEHKKVDYEHKNVDYEHKNVDYEHKNVDYELSTPSTFQGYLLSGTLIIKKLESHII